MGRRVDLHAELVNLLGSRNVYFQPPSNVNMNFPCIVYELEKVDVTKAENKVYHFDDRYSVVLITFDKDIDKIHEFLQTFDYISHSRTIVKDGLYHEYFTLHY